MKKLLVLICLLNAGCATVTPVILLEQKDNKLEVKVKVEFRAGNNL